MTRSFNPNNEVRQLVLSAFRNDPTASIDELVKAVGYSKTAVYYHLSNLINEGIITRENRPRGVYPRVAKAAKPKAEKIVKAPKPTTNAGNAYRTNSTNRVRTDEQKRIDMVVEAAQRKEAEGIVPAGVNMFFDHRVHRVLGRKTG